MKIKATILNGFLGIYDDNFLACALKGYVCQAASSGGTGVFFIPVIGVFCSTWSCNLKVGGN